MTSQGLDGELECPVCFDRFNIPKVLPCQHTCCANCLDRLTEDGCIRCPECRVIHPIPWNGFPINITMQRLLTASEIQISPANNRARPGRPGSRQLQQLPSRLPPVNTTQRQQLPELPSYYNEPNLPRIQTHRESSTIRQPTRATENNNNPDEDLHFDHCKPTEVNFFKVTRKYFRTVFSKFFEKNTTFRAVTTLLFFALTIMKLVGGAVKVSSGCPKQKLVAVYLLVKACLAFVFWFMMALMGCKKKCRRTMDNPVIEGYVVLESIFSLIWSIVGTIWIIEFRDEMIAECPLYEGGLDIHFITFAFFIAVFDWILTLAFILYSCFVQFSP